MLEKGLGKVLNWDIGRSVYWRDAVHHIARWTTIL